MSIITLTDANWRETIGNQPALISIHRGEGLRGDFVTAFKKAAPDSQTVIFAEVNPAENPKLAEQFNVGSKPLLIGWLNEQELVRRSRPWGSDVVLAVELLENQFKAEQEKLAVATGMTAPSESATASVGDEKMAEETNVTISNTPVKVTDDTFQAEVIEYSHEMPVLIDFWAEWCGPCRMVAPVMEKLAAEYEGKVRIAKVNTDENPDLSQAFRIMSIPTNMVFKDGHLVFQQPGAFPEPTYRDLLEQVIALDVEKAIAEQAEQEADAE